MIIINTDKIYIKDKDTHKILQEIDGKISQILIQPDSVNAFMKLIYKDGTTVKYVCIPLTDNIYISIDEND